MVDSVVDEDVLLVRKGTTAVPSHRTFACPPRAASFTVTSTTVTDGTAWPPEQRSSGLPGGKYTSPQPSWSGAPDGTKSHAVTVCGPDAPTGSGFWRWAVTPLDARC